MMPRRRDVIVQGAALAGIGLLGGAAAPSPVVETRSGRVRGERVDSVSVFRGIPYGDDTSGANRFQPPRPPKPWPGVRETIRYGDRGPQTGNYAAASRPGRPSAWSSFVATEPESENCLVLNVWTPGAGEQSSRPVMFWIHGGGFFMGSGSEPRMDGHNLAKLGDVVVVTINHRMGALGYLNLSSFGDPYAEMINVAQLDQIAALAWVRDNIAAFGGDPGNVTLFGNSGGGSKISTLMAMPRAKGLFHKAVIQSGSYLRCATPEESTRAAELLMAKLGVARGDVAALQRLPFQTIVAAYFEMRPTVRGVAPVMDGKTIPSHPFSPAALELSGHVPLMIGSTHTEASTLLGDPTAFDITWRTLPERWRAYAEDLGARIDAPTAASQMEGLRAAYPKESPSFIYFRAVGDLYTIFNAIEIADRKSAAGGAPVHLYEIGYLTPVDGGKWGAPHGMDVPLIFGNAAKAPSILPDDAAVRQVSDVLGRTWTAFARNGDPNNSSLPSWPRYAAPRRPAMVFDVKSQVVEDYRGVDRRLLGDLPRLVI